MYDSLRIDFDLLEDLDGVAPPIFRHALAEGEDESAKRDAIDLAARLAGHAETKPSAAGADLLVLGSSPDAGAGRTDLRPAGRARLDGAGCPVAVVPRDFAAAGREIGRIDVGIDGSGEAGRAFALGALLARAHDARLRAIAVAEPSFDLGGNPRPVDEAERERLARHLAQAAEAKPAMRVETELREGLADQILVGLAREADLLVLGSRASYGGAGRVALGHTGERVLRASRTPVLLVPAA